MGRVTHLEVLDGSRDSLGGPGRVGDPKKGLGRVGGPSGRSKMGRLTLG